jgi:hypothetical protein
MPILQTRLVVLLLHAALASGGCRNGAPAAAGGGPAAVARIDGRAADAPSPAVDPAPAPTPRRLAEQPRQSLACNKDSDCLITCRSDGDCCLEQCGCSRAMSRGFLQRLERHLAEQCGPDPLCPVAGCVGTKRYKARCVRGQCTAVKLPGSV